MANYNKVNRNKNYLLNKRDLNDTFRYSVHRARVTDVYVDEGTVNVEFEGIPYSSKVNFPLMGLSMPPKRNADDPNEKLSSWGRYIPQQGDVILVAFSPEGTLYALGYHAIFYEGFGYRDTDRKSTGGIGWGEASAKQIKPGDWDFKSARGSFLYLGDKAKLSSGAHSITANKSSGDVTIRSSLVQQNYSAASESRKGGARRRILPTDPFETSIYNLTAQVATESTDIVRNGFPQIEMARTSIGDVIDELTFQVMISTMGGTVIRRYEAVKDPTGLIDLYSKKVDDSGNFEISAPTAVLAQWVMPLASWNISNVSTSIISSTSFSVTAPTVTLTAPTGAVINSPNVQLGGPAAVDFLMKGTTFVSALDGFLTAVISATSVVGTQVQNATALAAIGIAAGALKSALGGVLSAKAKTE